MTADKLAAAWQPGDGPVKPLDLDAIRARIDAATRGPWDAYLVPGTRKEPSYVAVGTGGSEVRVARFEGGYFDADFMAHAREDIPALLAALAAETARADQAATVIATLESYRLIDEPPVDALERVGNLLDSAAPTTEQEA